MNPFKSLTAILALALVATANLFAQATTSSTTLSSAVAQGDQVVNVASATGITPPGALNQPTTWMFVDREELPVLGVTGTQILVRRGGDATPITSHASGAAVWFGAANYFIRGDPSGSCSLSSIVALPAIATDSGNVWTCPSSGPNSGLWARQATPAPFNFTDGAFTLPPSACVSSVSANGDTVQGLTTVGASVTPVMYASTTATSTNKHTYVCTITVPTRLTSGKGISITDATFYYGVQTTGLGTQVATLASGTMNSSTVFSYINFPIAGASETASTVTPVRADAGSLLITPAVASANVATTTAGAFYSVKFTPSAPLPINTDRQTLLLTVTLQAGATSATVTNTPGLMLHYVESPL